MERVDEAYQLELMDLEVRYVIKTMLNLYQLLLYFILQCWMAAGNLHIHCLYILTFRPNLTWSSTRADDVRQCEGGIMFAYFIHPQTLSHMLPDLLQTTDPVARLSHDSYNAMAVTSIPPFEHSCDTWFDCRLQITRPEHWSSPIHLIFFYWSNLGILLTNFCNRIKDLFSSYINDGQYELPQRIWHG